MDAVRLAAPTVLNVKRRFFPEQKAAAAEHSLAARPAGVPAGVLLVIAQGGHRIAYQHPPGTEPPTAVHGFDPQVLADMVITKTSLFEQLFDLTVGDTRLIGWPLSLQTATPVALQPAFGARTVEAAELDEGSRLRALTVAFVLGAKPVAGDEARYARALAGCQSAVEQLAHALQREEASSGLVSRHVAAQGAAAERKPRGSKEGDDVIGGSSIGGAASGGLGERTPSGRDALRSGVVMAAAESSAAESDGGFGVDEQAATANSSQQQPQQVPRMSSDATDDVGMVLRSALFALQEGRPITLRVGAHTDVAVCAPPPPPQPPRLAAVAGGMPPPPTLRPYLALLPLDDPNEIARELPPDASPLLVRLVHAANPLRSLEQLADETGIAMHMLMSLATHLQAWGKVRLIHPLTEHSILCIHPEFASASRHGGEEEDNGEPPPEFKRLFGIDSEPSYSTVLHLFDHAQPFGQIIRSAELIQLPKRRLVQMTTALLRDEALHSLHTYIHALDPEPPEPLATAPEAERARYKLYRRLKPMLHGEHHVEEIMWQERLGREVLNELVSAYSESLVAVVTPDESVL